MQAFKRGSAVRPGQLKKSHQGSHKFKKREANKKKAVKGQQVKLPTRQGRKSLEYALEEKALSSAIIRANEAKVASKMLQAGGKVSIGTSVVLLVFRKHPSLHFLMILYYTILYITGDITERGKEINREKRRAMLTKKKTKAELRLQVLEENQAILDDMDIGGNHDGGAD